MSTRTRVGRAPENELLIGATWVSSLHALIEWRPPAVWEIKDLGSRNGTLVNGTRLVAGQWQRLVAGDRIAFGDSQETWQITDVGRPVAEAHCSLTGAHRRAEDNILTLSTDPDDWVDVIEERPNSWVVERNGSCDSVVDGQELALGAHLWRLVLPAASQPTEPLPNIATPASDHVRLEFRVSANLEHVEMSIRCQQHEWTTSRAFTRCLLEMARARLTDASQGSFHPGERGWIYSDELCTLAGYESESRLNVEIHRARRELSRFGVPGAATLIQRRRGTGQLRIATESVQIDEFAGG